MHMSRCIVRMPGNLSLIWSLYIWKTSWFISNPNGMHRNQSLLLCVLNVVRYELVSLRWMLQSPSFASSFKDVVAPLSQCKISFGRVLCHFLR